MAVARTARPLRAALNRAATRAWFRSRAARRIAAAARRLKLRDELPDLAHISMYSEEILGPVQRDEALLLHSLIRVTRPRTVVEIGFLRGHSTFNFLEALDDEARIYTFDIDPQSESFALERFGHDPRVIFRLRSQADLTHADIDGRTVDFVFLDAAHDFDLNRQTFARLLPMLAPDAVIAVHDTGTIPLSMIPADHWWHLTDANRVGEDGEVESGERAFVNWLLEEHPDFAQVHLHTRRTPRCGLTLIQRSAPLPRPASA